MHAMVIRGEFSIVPTWPSRWELAGPRGALKLPYIVDSRLSQLNCYLNFARVGMRIVVVKLKY